MFCDTTSEDKNQCTRVPRYSSNNYWGYVFLLPLPRAKEFVGPPDHLTGEWMLTFDGGNLLARFLWSSLAMGSKVRWHFHKLTWSYSEVRRCPTMYFVNFNKLFTSHRRAIGPKKSRMTVGTTCSSVHTFSLRSFFARPLILPSVDSSTSLRSIASTNQVCSLSSSA